MRKPRYASKKAKSQTGWWKHARFGKRVVNKSERQGYKKNLKREPEFV